MQKYDSYKDSGVKWLGEIPSHWEVCKLKWLLYKNNVKVGPFGSSLTGKVENDLSIKVYGQWNIVANNFEAGANFISDETFNDLKAYEVQPGDFLISMMGTVGKCLLVPFGIKRGIMDSHILKLKLDGSKIDNRFFKYVYDKDNSNIVYQNIQIMKKGSIMDGLNSTIIKALLLPVPPIKEQEAIANYLDTATSKIDEAIAQQQKMIDLLNERKQIIINNAVTKGLDPNVKMKPSGIDWIGDIPEHWEILPMKYCMNIKNGMDYKHIETEVGIPVIGSGGQFAYASDFLYDGEVVFFGRKGTIDKPLYFKGKFWAVDTMFYAIPKNNINGKYLYYQGMTIPFKYYSTSTALPSMTQTDLGNNPICLPSLLEQNVIVKHLDIEIKKLDKTLESSRIKISLLQERKQIIINDVVTGKVKVI